MKKVNKKTLEVVNKIKGMNTKVWGPKLWDTLFIMLIGAYPAKLDCSKKDHRMIRKSFINLFSGLIYTLPCSFCRESFKNFIKELPVETYTGSRIDMMYWLFLMKDKVNTKLIKQEDTYFKGLKDKLKTGELDKKTYHEKCKLCFRTKKTPEFVEVLKKYVMYSSMCRKEIKKCF